MESRPNTIITARTTILRPGTRALKDMDQLQNGVVISVDACTYDDAGRLSTDTLDGSTTFTYNYVAGTSAIAAS